MRGYERDRQLLRELTEFAQTTPAGLARKAGVAVTTINRPYSGSVTTRLSLPTLDKLQAAFPQFPGWTEYLSRSAVAEPRQAYRGMPAAREQECGADMVAIAQIDLRFGLEASLMDEEVNDGAVETRLFPRDWLRLICASPPNMLYWAVGRGNSMEPAIGDGDVILIDRSEKTPGFGDLYWACGYGRTGIVKRLRPMPDGSVKILSDNPNVPPETAYDGELRIFGRVVAVIRRL